MPSFMLVADESEAAVVRELMPVLARGVATVTAFFGAPFPHTFEVVVHPDRASFDAALPPEWGLGATQCWMVATGVGDGLQLLSPRAWKREACEHDPDDAEHLEHLLVHELVHVYHGQGNASPDFLDTDGIDWFVEGLATFASGQLEEGHVAPAREALASGAGPRGLAHAWSGPYRYGVCGSLVAFATRERRAPWASLLAAQTGEELLELLGTDEARLLAAWREDVLSEELRTGR